MPHTTMQGFNELLSRLEITDLQGSTVSTRQTNVRDAVKKELVVLDDFLTGSYMRNTMIAPLSKADIDTFFVLDPGYYKVCPVPDIINTTTRRGIALHGQDTEELYARVQTQSGAGQYK